MSSRPLLACVLECGAASAAFRCSRLTRHICHGFPIIKEIRHSLNSEKLDQTFKFKPSDKMYEVGDEPIYLAVPANSEFASVQVTYKDGTTSEMQKVIRTK